MGFELSAEEVEVLMAELARLREEHRDLDSAIDALERLGAINQIQVQRLKKRKLYLRDRISHLEDQLTPDIIA
ncbi:YdcH family protein [Bosea sp. (in: a-proteobacteria)]|uniref:YdcH family protein n=1 Tax=Bosea sp. (in: a-proteobacteria) TaxID=1871050 RepID=UPI002FCAA87B